MTWFDRDPRGATGHVQAQAGSVGWTAAVSGVARMQPTRGHPDLTAEKVIDTQR